MKNSSFQTTDGEDLVLESVRGEGRVVGRMLDMHLEQRFRNPQSANVEVVYTFPLPWQAVLLGLEVELNGETLTAQVKAKTAARAEYEEALSEGDTGVLLTVNHDRSYTLELGNLMGGESCVVRLHYVQVLRPEQGSLRLTLPTTLAPRYGDPLADGGYEPHAVPDISSTVEYPFDIHLAVQGELVQAQIGSPSHRVAIRSIAAVGMGESHVIEVRLAAQAWLDRDFVLVFSELPRDSQGLAAWDRLDAGLGVVMASFTPRLPTRQSLPVTMKVLVDCSGSMNGDRIAAARRALQSILSGLKPTDRFSLSRFGSSVEHRSKGLWKAAPAAMAAARRWVETLEADLGGTEMNKAILSTLALSGAAQSDVLLITDGDIHAIDAVIESARQSGQRFFVVGIGSSVSEGLLRRLAEESGGSCEFVAPGEQVEPAILRLYQRMRSLVVTHARIEWPSDCSLHATSDLPKSVFDGDDITVFARLQATQTSHMAQPIKLRGRIDGIDGEVLLAEFTPIFMADEGNTLARLAANQRYWQLRQGGVEIPKVLTKQLPALAEKYQLVTDDTCLVLVKQRAEGERAQDMPQLRKVEGMRAAGWGGFGSSMRVPDVKYSVAPSSSMKFGRDLMSPESIGSTEPMFNNERVRQIESKAVRKLKHPTRSERLRAFIESIPTEPKPAEKHMGLHMPTRRHEFWNEGDAYSSDATEWFRYVGLTPAGVVELFRLNPDVSDSHVHAILMEFPLFLQEWLEFVIDSGYPEKTVMDVFRDVLLSYDLTFLQSVAKVLSKRKTKVKQPTDTLRPYMAKVLAGVTSQRWPNALLNFEHTGARDIP